eukprot:7318241-Prymnesium_polylepis.1
MLCEPSRASSVSASPRTPLDVIWLRGNCVADMKWTTWRPASCSCDVDSASRMVERTRSSKTVPIGSSFSESSECCASAYLGLGAPL